MTQEELAARHGQSALSQEELAAWHGKAVLPSFVPMGLQFVLKQDANFTSCRDARGRICPVCELHARYCGHTRDEMIAKLLPRRTPPVLT